MGREARINKAKRQRELDAFLATDEGKQALGAAKEQAMQEEAAAMARQLISQAERRAHARLHGADFAVYAQFTLDELKALASRVLSEVAAEIEAAGREPALLEQAIHLTEVGQLIREHEALVETHCKEGKGPNADQRATLERGHVFALADALARLSVLDNRGVGFGDWCDAVERPAPHRGAKDVDAQASCEGVA
jgi:hypothetical protein